MSAIAELMAILWDALQEAWAAADLGRRLAVWWDVVRHPETGDVRVRLT